MSLKYCAAALLVLISTWVSARPAVFLDVVHSSDPHHGHAEEPDRGHTEEADHHEEEGHADSEKAQETGHHEEEGHGDSEKAIHEHIQDHIRDHHDALVGHIEHHDKEVAGHHERNPDECASATNSVAVGLLTTVIFGPLLVYMTMSKAANGQVSRLTFQFIDLSTSIFLAVLWFTASSGVLEAPRVKKAFPQAEEAFAIMQVLLLYFIAMGVSYIFRENKMYLLTFCGCAGHYIAFCAIRAAGETQHKVQQGLPEEQRLYASVGFCFLVFGIFVGLSLVSFLSFRKKVDNEEYQEAVEELEYDVAGLVVSFAIIQAVRHALTGRYPPQAHMLLQQHAAASGGVDCGTMEHHFEHTAEQRLYMLLFAVVLTLVSIVYLGKMEEFKKKHAGYWVHKLVHVCQVVLVMCVAWGYLLWGEWQFYETYFHGDRMFGKMVFAILATSICLILTIVLAFAHENERLQAYGGYVNLIVMAMSLVAAWSWEHCFHTALNVIAMEYEVGYGGLVPKLVIALAIPLIILPGYIVFLKPIVIENEEKYAEQEEEGVLEKVQEAPGLSSLGLPWRKQDQPGDGAVERTEQGTTS